MISNWNPQANSSPITNSFLAINIDGLPFSISAIQQQDGIYLSQNDFSLKEGFKIKIRKKSPTPFHLYVRHSCDVVEDDGVIDSTDEKDSDQVHPPNFWVVLKKGIKGIKSHG